MCLHGMDLGVKHYVVLQRDFNFTRCYRKDPEVDPEFSVKIIHFFLVHSHVTFQTSPFGFMCHECYSSVWLFYHQGLLDEWTSKGPAVQDLNSKGSALCSLITFLTSPPKTKTPNKSGKHYIWLNLMYLKCNGKHGVWFY